MGKNLFKTEDAVRNYKKEVDLVIAKHVVELEDKEARLEYWERLKDELERDFDSMEEDLKFRYKCGQAVGRLLGMGMGISAAAIGYGIGTLIKYVIKTK